MSGWPNNPSPPQHPASIGQWPRRRPRARPLWPQILQLLAIAGFVVGGYQLTMWLWVKTAPKAVEVPKVVGLAREEAVKLLEARDLQYQIVAEKPSEEVAKGHVLESDPPAKRKVRVGRIVRLTLSSGSKWAKVPDVRDMSVDRARALVQEAGLMVGKESAAYHSKVPIGYVIGQKPKAGEKVLRGSGVVLVVSRGPRPPEEVIGEERPQTGRRSTEVEVVVPPGPSLQEVRVVVRDRNGEREVYTGYHQPGDKVIRTVSGEGPGIVVQVFLSGILVQERSF